MNTDFKTINFDDLINEDDVVCDDSTCFSSELSEISNEFVNIVDLVEFDSFETSESEESSHEVKSDLQVAFYSTPPPKSQLSQHLSKSFITIQQCEEITTIWKETKFIYLDVNVMSELRKLDFYQKFDGDPWLHSWIKFFKYLGCFQMLEEEDRFTLLCDNFNIFAILDDISKSTVNGECWVIEDVKDQTEIIPHNAYFAVYGCHLANDYSQLISAFLPRWREDRILMLLLILIGFFTPTQTMPYKDRNKIWKIQSGFYDLLRRYLKLKYPKDSFLFVAMIGLLARTRALAEKQKEIQTDGGLLSRVLCNMPSQEISEIFKNLTRLKKSRPLQRF